MSYNKRSKAVLLLEDGTVFFGKSIGISGKTFGEICFNTGMTGYQEIYTDPSYFGQIMVMATPHIGNYGVSAEDIESSSIKIAGLVVKNFSFFQSRPKSEESLFDYLKKQQVICIADVDTRALVSHIRDNGAQNAIIATDDSDLDELKKMFATIPSMKGLELASKVSAKEPYLFGSEKAKYRIAALDLGIKTNILRNFTKRDCYIKVFPYNTSFEEINSFNPDAYFLSNGPGDPEPLLDVIVTAKKMIASHKPVFGICLGHQILALANNIPTYKMFNGHRGINHPVKNIITGKGEITSQNHGFAVVKEAFDNNDELEITHIHINDGTVAGMRMKNYPCFSVQYHPEASPGPHDSSYLFDDFVALIEKSLNEKVAQ